jgi:hypothetical protein
MAKKVHITGHDLSYHDYSMKHEWDYEIKDLDISGTNIATNGRNNVQVNATLTSGAKLKADYLGGLDWSTQDTRMTLNIKGVQLKDFSPLCQNYTGYPLNGGELMLDSRIDVTSGKMNGTNRLEIDHPRVGRKELLSKAPYKNIPVRTGFKILTSSQDMILLDVPVSGDAKNPKFSFRKVVGRALLKVFFGPLMGVNDRNKSLSNEEIEQMQELLGEDSALFRDTLSQSTADVAMTASDSVGLTEVGE